MRPTRSTPVTRWTAAATGGVLALVCAGCGTPRVLAARPLPIMLSPPSPSWGMSIAIEPNERLRVRLVNESPEAISVLWEECAYIDVDNRSHPITPSAARQARSTVAPGSYLEETIVPVGGEDDTSLDPLLPTKSQSFRWLPGRHEKRPRLGSRVGRYHPLVGKQIGVFLVLERGGERKTLLAKYTIQEDHGH